MSENRHKITENRLENSKENEYFAGDDHQIQKNACGGSNEVITKVSTSLVNSDEFKDVPLVGKSEENISDKTEENSDSSEGNVCREAIKDSTSVVNKDDFKNTPFLAQNEEKDVQKSGKILDSKMAQTDTKQCSKRNIQNGSNCKENGKSEIGEIFERKTGDVERCTPGSFPENPVKMDQLVVRAVKNSNRETGATFSEIKRYITSNCDVNVNGIDLEINSSLRRAVANQVLIMKVTTMYSLRLPENRPKRRAKCPVHGTLKKRNMKAPSKADKSPKLQEEDEEEDE